MAHHTSMRQDLGSILRNQATSNPDLPFVTTTADNVSLTYAEFDALVNSLATGLGALGVQRGQFINVMLGNRLEYLVTSYALKKLGAVEVAINAEARGVALARMINLAKSGILVTDSRLAEHISPISDTIEGVEYVVGVDGYATDYPSLVGSVWVSYLELSNYPSVDPDLEISDLDPATVIFTSGTTGPSKGCVLPHRALVRAAEVVRDAMSLTAADRMYTPYPLFHMRAAYLDVLGSILAGASVVVAPRFSASKFWQHMRDHRITTFSLIGTTMQILWKQQPSAIESDHRVRLTWGGPLPIPANDFESRFGIAVLPGDGVFGMSETGMLNMSSFNPLDSGQVRPIYDVRIADEDGDPVRTGEIGEILVRPVEPGVMYLGYLNMPDATLDAWEGMWFHTGDLGRLDERNRLTFVARKREMIRRGGNNISTWEIEEVVDAHPEIIESAAVGIPSPLGEQEVKLFVVTKPDTSLSSDDLRAYCSTRMAAYMVPQHFDFIDQMPKTQTGKIAKAQLTRG